MTPSFSINLIASHSSPPPSRDHDHRFSSLVRPAVSISAVSACGYPEAACCCTSTLAFTTVLLPESSEIINPRGSQLKPHVTKDKSYFRQTHPGLQSLVPSLSPLLVRFLRVCLQVDSSRLLVTTAACKHQSCLTQSSSKC